jgi:hypothetical protein
MIRCGCANFLSATATCLFSGLLIGLFSGLVSCQKLEKPPMPTPTPTPTPAYLEARLDQLDPKDKRSREVLADSLRQETYGPAETLVKYWRRHTGPDADKALFVLQRLGPAAYPALMQDIDTVTPEDRIFILEDQVERHVQQRRELAAKLIVSLDDKRLLQVGSASPAPASLEQPPPPSRVCDRAYLLLRRLVNNQEDEEQGAREAWQFLRLEDAQKDAAIGKARVSREWQTFFEAEE